MTLEQVHRRPSPNGRGRGQDHRPPPHRRLQHLRRGARAVRPSSAGDRRGLRRLPRRERVLRRGRPPCRAEYTLPGVSQTVIITRAPGRDAGAGKAVRSRALAAHQRHHGAVSSAPGLTETLQRGAARGRLPREHARGGRIQGDVARGARSSAAPSGRCIRPLRKTALRKRA